MENFTFNCYWQTHKNPTLNVETQISVERRAWIKVHFLCHFFCLWLSDCLTVWLFQNTLKWSTWIQNVECERLNVHKTITLFILCWNFYHVHQRFWKNVLLYVKDSITWCAWRCYRQQFVNETKFTYVVCVIWEAFEVNYILKKIYAIKYHIVIHSIRLIDTCFVLLWLKVTRYY